MNILDLYEPRRSFLPSTPLEYIALRLSREAGDLTRLTEYLKLVDQNWTKAIEVAVQEACQRKSNSEFHAEHISDVH